MLSVQLYHKIDFISFSLTHDQFKTVCAIKQTATVDRVCESQAMSFDFTAVKHSDWTLLKRKSVSQQMSVGTRTTVEGHSGTVNELHTIFWNWCCLWYRSWLLLNTWQSIVLKCTVFADACVCLGIKQRRESRTLVALATAFHLATRLQCERIAVQLGDKPKETKSPLLTPNYHMSQFDLALTTTLFFSVLVSSIVCAFLQIWQQRFENSALLVNFKLKCYKLLFFLNKETFLVANTEPTLYYNFSLVYSASSHLLRPY